MSESKSSAESMPYTRRRRERAAREARALAAKYEAKGPTFNWLKREMEVFGPFGAFGRKGLLHGDEPECKEVNQKWREFISFAMMAPHWLRGDANRPSDLIHEAIFRLGAASHHWETGQGDVAYLETETAVAKLLLAGMRIQAGLNVPALAEKAFDDLRREQATQRTALGRVKSAGAERWRDEARRLLAEDPSITWTKCADRIAQARCMNARSMRRTIKEVFQPEED